MYSYTVSLMNLGQCVEFHPPLDKESDRLPLLHKRLRTGRRTVCVLWFKNSKVLCHSGAPGSVRLNNYVQVLSCVMSCGAKTLRLTQF